MLLELDGQKVGAKVNIIVLHIHHIELWAHFALLGGSQVGRDRVDGLLDKIATSDQCLIVAADNVDTKSKTLGDLGADARPLTVWDRNGGEFDALDQNRHDRIAEARPATAKLAIKQGLRTCITTRGEPILVLILKRFGGSLTVNGSGGDSLAVTTTDLQRSLVLAGGGGSRSRVTLLHISHFFFFRYNASQVLLTVIVFF